MKWSLRGTGRIYDASESMCVYFAENSGNTHAISSEAAVIIAALTRESLSVEELFKAVSDPHQTSDLSLSAMTDILHELEAAQLIRPAECLV